jgi:hypothetical protein
MTEQFRPQPENPKQKAPEAGAGPLGLPPPPAPEQAPQVDEAPNRIDENDQRRTQSPHTPTTIYSNPGIPDDLIEELNKLLS